MIFESTLLFFLRAISSTLKRDFSGPDYKFHDDPFLIPYTSRDKSDYVLAKQGGKRAARYMIEKNAELFNNNLIEMQPVIKKYLPKLQITKKNSTLELLETLIQGCNVMDAKQVYEILTKEKNVEISIELKQAYLELLSYHNSDDQEVEENANEFKVIFGITPDKWKTGAEADMIANEIIESEGLKSEAAHQARLSLMYGRSKFNDHHGVLQIYDEIKANGGKLDTKGFNALIFASRKNSQIEWSEIKNILVDMNAQEIQPDRETMLRIFQGLGKLASQTEALTLALQSLAEFRSLQIEPCLGVYLAILKMLVKNPKQTILIDIINELSEVQKLKGTLLNEIVSDECFNFFREAMIVTKNLNLDDLYHKINDLVMNDPNADVLRGGIRSSSTYHESYLTCILRNESLDSFMKYLELYTPHMWSPILRFYTTVLDNIQKNHAPQYLPKIWTDLVESEFDKSGRDNRAEFFVKFLNVVKTLGDNGDENLQRVFAKIPQEMFTHLESRYTNQRRGVMPTMYDSQICNMCLELSLDYQNIETADKIVNFCKTFFTVLDGNLSGDSLKKYVYAMIQEGSSNEAYGAVIFMKEAQYVEHAEEMAIAVGAKLVLNEDQRKMFNSLFSSSSKWVML